MSAIEKLAVRVTEAADALGVSRSKVYQMVASGELPTVEIGGARRVPVEALRSLVSSQLERRT
jgi:excisionase family DNA binding protein